jgi:excisionase family DNA binding protein
MITMTEAALLTVKEVAEKLRISTKTVKWLIVTGKLEGIMVGTRWRVRPEALDRYLARNTRPEETN